MKANEIQVGGSHYQTDGSQQHWDLMELHDMGYLESAATKYIERMKVDKKEDLQKAVHYIQKLKELSDLFRHNKGNLTVGLVTEYLDGRQMSNRCKGAFMTVCLWQTPEDLKFAIRILQEEIASL